jgi:hypothetical protein
VVVLFVTPAVKRFGIFRESESLPHGGAKGRVIFGGRDPIDDNVLAANPRRRFSKRDCDLINRPRVVDDYVASVQHVTRTFGIDETHDSVPGENRHGEVSDNTFGCRHVRLETVREVEQSL